MQKDSKLRIFQLLMVKRQVFISLFLELIHLRLLFMNPYPSFLFLGRSRNMIFVTKPDVTNILYIPACIPSHMVWFALPIRHLYLSYLPSHMVWFAYQTEIH